MLFLFKGNIKINNDTKKKVKFDISFYFVETNRKGIFCKFFLRWLNSKKKLRSLLTLRSSMARNLNIEWSIKKSFVMSHDIIW